MTNIHDNVFDVLKNAIRSQMNEYADHVSGGGCNDVDDATAAAVGI